MARPPSRRPGHNRKAQYSLFASYVVAMTGAAVGLLLVVVAIFDPTGFAVIRTATAEITRPASIAMRNRERFLRPTVLAAGPEGHPQSPSSPLRVDLTGVGGGHLSKTVLEVPL